MFRFKSRATGLPACRRAEGAGQSPRAGSKTAQPRSFLRGAGPVRLAILIILTLAAALTYAQTAAEKPSMDTRRVGSRLACQCGCKDSLATCSMLECSFSKPSKERIAKMQALGMSDQQIIDAFVAQYGPAIYLAPPNLFGMLIPYLAVVFGVLVIWWFIRRYRPAPLPELGAMELDDPDLAKYKDQIEKDLANLE